MSANICELVIGQHNNRQAEHDNDIGMGQSLNSCDESQQQPQAMSIPSDDKLEPSGHNFECRVCGQLSGAGIINIFDENRSEIDGETGNDKGNVLLADKIALAFATVVSGCINE